MLAIFGRLVLTQKSIDSVDKEKKSEKKPATRLLIFSLSLSYRSNRPRKSPDNSGDPSESSKRSYYDERYNRSSRDRDRDRRDDREHRRH